jgi:hypothetical protein
MKAMSTYIDNFFCELYKPKTPTKIMNSSSSEIFLLRLRFSILINTNTVLQGNGQKLPDLCLTVGWAGLLLSYWLALYSRWFSIFKQPHLAICTVRNAPNGSPLLFGHFQNVSNTYVIIAPKVPILFGLSPRVSDALHLPDRRRLGVLMLSVL